jgi:hypothetical protein
MNPLNLSPKEIKFLEKNFTLYDPAIGKCYNDFSSLINARVVLIGEIHQSDLMHRLQQRLMNILFRVWGEVENYCLLLEGLKTGLQLDREKIPFLKNLPPTLTIHGSESRDASFDNHQMEIFLRISEFKIQSGLKLKEGFKCTTRKIAEHLNGTQLSFENRILEMSAEAFVKLHQFLQEFDLLLEQHAVALRESNHSTLPSYNLSLRDVQLLKSNEGLTECIKGASLSSAKVLAIWGWDHFLTGKAIVDTLKAMDLQTVVIMPNKRRIKESTIEIKWNKRIFPQAYFRAKDLTHVEEVSIPREFLRFFHPRIQEHCKIMPKDKPIIYDPKKLIKHFLENTTLTIPTHKNMYLNGVEHKYYVNLCEDPYRLGDSMADWLLLGGFSFTRLSCDASSTQFNYCFDFKTPRLEISTSTHPFVLEAERGPLFTSTSTLFMLMITHKIHKLSIVPGQMIGFHDLSTAERTDLIQNPHKLTGWIRSKVPPRYRLEISGSINLYEGVYNKPGMTHPVLWLKSTEGFKFQISKIPPPAAPASSSS